jgi:hypothetical protein
MDRNSSEYFNDSIRIMNRKDLMFDKEESCHLVASRLYFKLVTSIYGIDTLESG